MKKLLSIIFSVSLTFGLCSCSQKENQSDLSSAETQAETTIAEEDTYKKVHLEIWCEENNVELMNEMIESFKAKYAGQADFDFEIVPNLDSKTRDNVLSDIHNSADIFPLPDDQLSALVGAGALEPVPNAQEIKNANIEEASEAAMINGTMYAYPMTADNGYFLFYNKEYLTETDVQTLEGILSVAENAGKKFSMEFTSGWYMYSFFGNTGLEFGINDDGVTNYCNWNTTEGSVKGVDIVQALLDISSSPAFESRPDDEFTAGVKDGTIIAGISGVWNAMEVKEAWGDDYGAVKLPTYTCAGKQIQMSSFTGYKMIGVNYYCENKEWACKFADWITNSENQTLRFNEKNQGPSNKISVESEEIMKVPAIQAVIEQSKYGRLQRVGNNYWSPFEEFGNTIAQGNPENLELQDIIDKLVNGITAQTVS